MVRWAVPVILALLIGCGIGGGAVSRNWRSYGPVQLQSSPGVVNPSAAARAIDRASVVRTWGEPDAVETSANGCEILRYHRELGFSGILLWPVVPVPVLLPVGWRDTSVYLHNGQVLGFEQEFADWSLFGCFYFVHAAGCGVANERQPEDRVRCPPWELPGPVYERSPNSALQPTSFAGG